MKSNRPALEPAVQLLFLICTGVLLYSRLHFMHVPFDRDEGEYAYVGQLLLHGFHPYKDAYNMKFPGTYFFYAFIMWIGGQNVEAIRYGTFIIVIISALLVFLLAKKLFNTTVGLLALVIFLALNSTMEAEGLMSNAEHFVMLFAIAGIYVLFRSTEYSNVTNVFLSGLLLGCAVIMKQQGYVFVLFALFLLFGRLVERPGKSGLKKILIFCLGAATPAILLIIYIVSIGAWTKFSFLTFDYGREYLKLCSSVVAHINWSNNLPCVKMGTKPLWQALLISVIGILIPIRMANRFNLLLLLIFSVIALSSGGYYRVHYFILVYFSLTLVLCLLIYNLSKINYYIKAVSYFSVSIVLILFFIVQRDVIFASDPLKVYLRHYRCDGFNDMKEMAVMASGYLGNNDRLAMFSNEPELYFYSGHRAASPWLYNYPFFENQKYSTEMLRDYLKDIDANQGKLFLYSAKPVNDMRDETRQVWDDWWRNHQKDFELQGVYYVAGPGQGIFKWKPDVSTDTSWMQEPNFQFWLRREKS